MKRICSHATKLVLSVSLLVCGPGTIHAGAQETESLESLAQHLVDQANVTRGLISVLGCADGRLIQTIGEWGDFAVHAVDPSPDAVAATRRRIDEANLYGRRVVIEQGSYDRLVYAEHLVDAVLAAELNEKTLGALSLSEVIRALRPRGKAVLGRGKDVKAAGTLSKADLEKWARASGVPGVTVTTDPLGVWATVTKPPLDGADEWNHWEHGPDNNPVSNDQVIKAPYMTQFLGAPYYIAMPAITTSAAGRIYIAMGHIAHHKREEPWLNTLVARSGYNGTPLWTRKLPDGYLAHRSAFIATEDAFFMIDPNGTGCLLLDPDTGEQMDRITVPGERGEWKWMAMEDDVLYVLIGKQKDPAQTTVVRSELPHWSWGELSKGYYGKRVPWGFGQTIVAIDLKSKNPIWKHKEKVAVDSRAMSMGHGKMFIYGPDSHVAALDMKTGEVIWTNPDSKLREMIEEPGQGLTSTPGFRTMCYALNTPDVLFFEAQTRMNVVAISTKDGRWLWHRKKTSNNPNMLFLDEKLVVGVGQGGETLVVDPLTGKIEANLGFTKRSCARLTATPDSLFCRGWPEGLTRFDRNTKQVSFNGAFRPSCNDGVVAANGLLYLGPWACDCNLSLMGRVALSSAGDFRFDRKATEAERLEVGVGDLTQVAPLEVTSEDWPTYRGNTSRSSGTTAAAPATAVRIWETHPSEPFSPTSPTAAGGLIFLAGDDGKVRAIDAKTGAMKWTYLTAGPILQPPTIWNGRAYVGSGDGYIYCVEAATGRMLWRFRAAPVERRIMVYGSLCSTWPVNSGVLVTDGVAYAAAGIIDYDGTYVYALDAITGRIKWQNTTSGHLDPDLRKGVSAQGTLTIAAGRLWLAGGNVISPAAYDLKTGAYVGPKVRDGAPQSNRGQDIGIFRDKYVILGGRLRFSAGENVVNEGSFAGYPIQAEGVGGQRLLTQGRIPPAWNDQQMVYVAGRQTPPAGSTAEAVAERFEAGDSKRPIKRAWSANWLKNSDTVGLILTPTATVAITENPRPRQLATRWMVNGLNPENGAKLWQQPLPSAARQDGGLVDRDGRIAIVLQDGSVVCFGGKKALQASLEGVLETAEQGPEGRRRALGMLRRAIRSVRGADREMVIETFGKLGVEIGREARANGCVIDWHLIGPVAWGPDAYPTDHTYVGEPNVDVTETYVIGGRKLKWERFLTHHSDGRVDLDELYGLLSDSAVYAHAEFELEKAQPLKLKIGSNDGFKCWFNGEVIGRFEGGRGFSPDEDVLEVAGRTGTNRILMKIMNQGNRWAFAVRVTDVNDQPVEIVSSKG